MRHPLIDCFFEQDRFNPRSINDIFPVHDQVTKINQDKTFACECLLCNTPNHGVEWDDPPAFSPSPPVYRYCTIEVLLDEGPQPEELILELKFDTHEIFNGRERKPPQITRVFSFRVIKY